jgi:hypothetical protein
MWEQVRDIVVFAGPALGLWICGPLMSLIDTMVIGQTSALQLAALGPPPFLFFCVLSSPSHLPYVKILSLASVTLSLSYNDHPYPNA